jgi:MinD superfamily P-loop ATPase
MRIAIASGKGGTGKTILATNLARLLGDQDDEVTYLDCDVEAPNGHIFLAPRITDREPVTIPIPQVDEARCTHCGRCGEVCQAHAIVCLGSAVLTFPELCSGCGGCRLVCPETAIREVPHEIGEVSRGTAGPVRFVEGRLRVGQAKAPPVIRAVQAALPRSGIAILDAPPGTSCPVVTTLTAADAAILVTEPTPFGLHDLTLAVALVRTLDLPFAVVVNRMGVGDGRVHAYCQAEEIPILLEIPDDRRIAEAYSRGLPIVDALPAYREHFTRLLRGARGLSAAGRR